MISKIRIDENCDFESSIVDLYPEEEEKEELVLRYDELNCESFVEITPFVYFGGFLIFIIAFWIIFKR